MSEGQRVAAGGGQDQTWDELPFDPPPVRLAHQPRPAWISAVAGVLALNGVSLVLYAGDIPAIPVWAPDPLPVIGTVSGLLAVAAAAGVVRQLAWARWLGLALLVSWLAREVALFESWLRMGSRSTDPGSPNLLLDLALPVAVNPSPQGCSCDAGPPGREAPFPGMRRPFPGVGASGPGVRPGRSWQLRAAGSRAPAGYTLPVVAPSPEAHVPKRYVRLTQPLVRDSKDGPLRAATWDEALDRTAVGLRAAVATQRPGGPSPVGIFSCSKATNEVNFAAQKLARVALGSNNIDSCNRT